MPINYVLLQRVNNHKVILRGFIRKRYYKDELADLNTSLNCHFLRSDEDLRCLLLPLKPSFKCCTNQCADVNGVHCLFVTVEGVTV